MLQSGFEAMNSPFTVRRIFNRFLKKSTNMQNYSHSIVIRNYSYHRISFETYLCRYLSSPQKHTVTYLKQKEKRKIRQFKINGKASSPISILERVSKTIQKLQNSTSSLLLHHPPSGPKIRRENATFVRTGVE